MAAVLLYDSFGEEKADAVALDVVDITGGHAVEFLEDMGLLLGSDTDAFVLDRYPDVAILFVGRETDVCAVAGVLDGIVQECGKDAGHQGGIYVGREAFRCDADGYFTGLPGTEAGLCRDGFQQRAELRALDTE